MTPFVLRFIRIRFIGLGLGLAVGAVAAALFLHFSPSSTPLAVAQPTERAQGWQQEVTPAESAKWITADCKAPASWDKEQIPASAVVRNDTDLVISHIGFDKAYDLAESGVVWIIALCGRA